MMATPPAPRQGLDPSEALARAVRGYRNGELEQAARACGAALQAEPHHFDALHLLGVIRFQQGRLADALAHIEAALKLNSTNASAFSNLGAIFGNLNRPREALESYDKALSIHPAHAEAHNNRGAALRALGRHEEALASYDRALAIRSDYAEAHNNRGVALRDLGRPEEALASYDRALAVKPDYAEALSNRGAALAGLGRSEEALASYDAALAIRPNSVEALSGRGVALRDLGRGEEALASQDRALTLRPGSIEALNNRGNALRDLGRCEEALASYDKALAIRPDSVDALYNRGLTALLTGDFPLGWSGYERRWDVRDPPPRKLVAPYPAWKGEDLRGKRVIVYEEQGLGDIIQFSRFLPRLSLLGASVTFLIRPSLRRLLQPLAAAVRLVEAPPVGEAFDFQCALLSVPGALGVTLETMPAAAPYLSAEPPRVAEWRRRVGDHGLKIGVCWQGRPLTKIDRGRSAPLRCFEPIARIAGVRLISLQKVHGLDQLSDLPAGMRVETLGADFDNGPDAFLDAAAVMSCLDLVISTDTSVAHLAGALGRPVWVALKRAPDWRWLRDRADSPWYATMRLYRQAVGADWDEVFARIAADVVKWRGDPERSRP